MSRLAQRLKRIEPYFDAKHGHNKPVVYGIVDYVDEQGNENYVRKWKGTIGKVEPTDEEPTIKVALKLEPFITMHRKYKCAFGGRAATKSVMAVDCGVVGDVAYSGAKVCCVRERMTSLKDSVFSAVMERSNALGFGGFRSVRSQWEITHSNRGLVSFRGLQNFVDIKSSFNVKRYLMEEAHETSQDAIDTLGPTVRGVEGGELWYIWNTQSSSDAMSKTFIVPYQAELDRNNGVFIDESQIIIYITYLDNPWFHLDQALVDELAKNKRDVKRGLMSQARFDWIWLGKYNDTVEDSIIIEDDFDLCIDAHDVLGFGKKGARTAGFDPADTGQDAKGFAVRKGVVVEYLQEIQAENGNRATDIVCEACIDWQVSAFGWDCDGLGATLRDNVDQGFKGYPIHLNPYKGSMGVHDPHLEFVNARLYGIKGDDRVLNSNVFKNRKAQNIVGLADRVRLTASAVRDAKANRLVNVDPDTLISFDSQTIDPSMLSKLRAEACKTPTKKNYSGRIEFYSKRELQDGIPTKTNKRMKIPSPNLFDAVVLSFDKNCTIEHKVETPKPTVPQVENNW